MKLMMIKVVCNYAPEEDDKFKEWAETQGFDVLDSGRRAWCDEFRSYFRDALGVAETMSGERFLFNDNDVLEDIKL